MKPIKSISTATEGRRVLISVRGEQYFDGVDPDATELVTEGLLQETEEGLLLSYEESALTGMEGTTTTFQVCGQPGDPDPLRGCELPDDLRGGKAAHLPLRDPLRGYERGHWHQPPAPGADLCRRRAGDPLQYRCAEHRHWTQLLPHLGAGEVNSFFPVIKPYNYIMRYVP